MKQEIVITDYVKISGSQAFCNGEPAFSGSADFASFIRELYKWSEVGYSPFFKMDNLSKLGFMASELLLKGKDRERLNGENVGVVFSNRSSSLDSDIAYYNTIKDPAEYFPSPAVFVYTLPNIVIGEICIRNKFKGENMFFLSESFDEALMAEYVNNLLEGGSINTCLAGWVEYFEDRYKAFVYLATPAKLIDKNTGVSAKLHSAEILNNLFNK